MEIIMIILGGLSGVILAKWFWSKFLNNKNKKKPD